MNKRVIEVVAYNPRWQQLFSQEKLLLNLILGQELINIEHIGSTSVTGLAAKPIIDILVEVKNLDFIDTLNLEFEKLGYKPKGENGIEGRRYFQKGGASRSHHIHMFELNNSHAFNHRLFRDYLMTHSKVACDYAEIKRKAASQCNHDMSIYMSMKDKFIKSTLADAKVWHDAQL